ncbi:MAG: hypothetical protein LC772_06585 [Chloroflexi bacterium]|nr:hypothetical protein [Chloroflexota bacterium]
MPGENQNTNVGGDGKNTGSGTDDKEKPAGETGGAGDGSQEKPKENAGGDEKRLSQAEVDAIAARIRDEEKRKYDARLKSAADEADRKKAEEQGEFQKLYETEKSRAAELEQKAQKADQYAGRINQVLDGETKDWPAEVRKTDPGPERLDDRLAWVESHRDLAKRLLAAGQAPNMEHGRQGRTIKATDITDNYLKEKYARPAAAG